ncbi:MAG: UvrD-helicase domain-containing protein [Patescibacteria group bacterium]
MADFDRQDLNSGQKEAADCLSGPLLIAAGAGSGKTRALTHRLLNLIESGVPPQNIIAITFTNKAAKEMADRLARGFGGGRNSGNAPFIGTFHSFGARILKNEAALVDRSPNFSIFDEGDSLKLIKNICKNFKEGLKPAAVRAKISRFKNELISAEENEKNRGDGDFDEAVAAIFLRYEEALRLNNAFDFDDLIEKAVRIFRAHPAVLQKYRERFRYILVDEYQDVNTGQYLLVRLLAAEHQNVCVVGDDQQSIYGFRGSDFRNFLNFERDWRDAKVVLLEENFRSTKTILRAANEVIKNNKLQKSKNLWTGNPAGEPIEIFQCASRVGEAALIASEIKNLLEKKDAGETAVLYRTNAQSRAIEQALIDGDVFYEIFGGLEFYERKEIKDIVAALRVVSNGSDAVSAERLRKVFGKRRGEELLADLKTLAAPAAGGTAPAAVIDFFLKKSDYLSRLENDFENFADRAENIRELIDFAGHFENLGDFLERVTLFQAHDKISRSGAGRPAAVKLMTIHLSKGLEFDNVFVAGFEEGLLPHERSTGAANEIEEERRLVYVALTRARRRVFLTFAETPSRFLFEIPEEVTRFRDAAGREGDLDDEMIYIE